MAHNRKGKLAWSKVEKRFYSWDGFDFVPLDDEGNLSEENVEEVMDKEVKEAETQKRPYVLEIFATSITTILSVLIIAVVFQNIGLKAIDSIKHVPPSIEIPIQNPK